MGIESEFRQGMRVTDERVMNVVEMVLGELNQEIVGLINQHGGKAVGLTGQDGKFIQRAQDDAEARPTTASVDIGFVGEIEPHRSGAHPAARLARLHPGHRADRRRHAKARPTTSTPIWSPASSPRR